MLHKVLNYIGIKVEDESISWMPLDILSSTVTMWNKESILQMSMSMLTGMSFHLYSSPKI